MTFCEMYKSSGCNECPNRYVCKQKLKSEFAIQVIAKGSYVDGGTGDGDLFLVETTVIRMNHVALNAWLLSEMDDCRECFETDEEWEAHKAEYEKRQAEVRTRIIEALGIDASGGSVCITQSQSEVFTVVHISEITPA